MNNNQRICTECLGVHPDGQCLVTTPWELSGEERDGEPERRLPSQEKIAAAAATVRRLLEEDDARLQLLERGLERARDKVRELTAARAETRRALKSLGQALDVLVAAAASAIPKATRQRGTRLSKPPN